MHRIGSGSSPMLGFSIRNVDHFNFITVAPEVNKISLGDVMPDSNSFFSSTEY
jgi:hypothetical protein